MSQWHRWQRQFDSRGPDSLWRDLPRTAAVIGALVAVVGAFLPWASGSLPKAGPREVSGFAAPGDSIFMIWTALCSAGILSIRGLAESRSLLPRVLPVVITAAMVVVWFQDYVAARREVETWLAFGGSGSIAPGLWLIAVGILLMALGTIWLALRGPIEAE
jgi:hypothetical protein